MRTTLFAALSAALLAAYPAAQGRASRTLDIYVVDVEGGNATLFVASSGESLLIDAGNGGAAAARDADRIMAAVNDAGLKQIDNLVITQCPFATSSITVRTSNLRPRLTNFFRRSIRGCTRSPGTRSPSLATKSPFQDSTFVCWPPPDR